jgi:Uma2 family endonuclease
MRVAVKGSWWSWSRATAKVAGWLAAGCLEVWSVDPGSRTVTVHTASHGPALVGEAGSFVSTAVPGLSVTVANLFPSAS